MKTKRYASVHGFAGYRAGKDGSVWSCWYSSAGGRGSGRGRKLWRMGIEWKKMKANLRTGDYPRIGLRKSKGTTVVLTVHKIILLAFVGPPKQGMYCRHLDGNKHNNALSNLKYGTPSQNSYDAVRHGTACIGSAHPLAKLNPDSVRQIRKSIAAGKTLDELAAQYHVDRNAIWLAATRKTWKSVE